MTKILLNPGPTNTADDTKVAQTVGSDVCHRTENFKKLFSKTKRRLLEIYGDISSSEIAIMGGSGTTALESMITSLVPPKTTVIVAGIYGKRAVEIMKTFNIEHEIILCKSVDELYGSSKVKSLYFVENETTSGEHFPISKMIELYPNAKFFIDATSSFGSSSYHAYLQHINALCFCSNKCLQSVPGLGIVLWNKILNLYSRTFYGDLSKYIE